MSRPSPDFLFVYGTLRRGTGHPMSVELEGKAVWGGRAHLAGACLVELNGYPGWVQASRGEVVGDLYGLPDEPARAMMLTALDDYEGIDPVNGYVRVETRVVGVVGRVRCWAYQFRGDVAGRRRIPGGDWLHWISGGNGCASSS